MSRDDVVRGSSAWSVILYFDYGRADVSEARRAVRGCLLMSLPEFEFSLFLSFSLYNE